jgi:hypothetical protein
MDSYRFILVNCATTARSIPAGRYIMFLFVGTATRSGSNIVHHTKSLLRWLHSIFNLVTACYFYMYGYRKKYAINGVCSTVLLQGDTSSNILI